MYSLHTQSQRSRMVERRDFVVEDKCDTDTQ